MVTVKTINITLEMFGGALSLMIAISLLLGKRDKNKLNSKFIHIAICNMFVLISDAASWIWKGNLDSLSCFIVPVANFLVFVLGYLLLGLFTDYLVNYVSTKIYISKLCSNIMWIVVVFAILLVCISQFNHMYYVIDANNQYCRQDLYWLSQAWGVVCLLINSGILFYARKSLHCRELFILSGCIVLPVIAMLIQIFIYGVALLYVATAISCQFLYMEKEINQAELACNYEKELMKEKNLLLLSKIQPHFLFNTLNSIAALCDIDVQRAKSAILTFSTYLRNNLNRLDTSDFIPFTEEIIHIKQYLALQKIRYEDDLNVVYDFQIQDFMIPSMILQPIVENAIKHGIQNKEGPGCITISTYQKQDVYCIKVKDDGIGFPDIQETNQEHTHIGLSNVRDRLTLLCHGTITIESERGAGTVVSINIPKNKEENE